MGRRLIEGAFYQGPAWMGQGSYRSHPCLRGPQQAGGGHRARLQGLLRPGVNRFYLKGKIAEFALDRCVFEGDIPG